MKAFRGAAALAVLLALAACRIERTPTRYLDHPNPAARDRSDAVAELQDRLLSLGPALRNGHPIEARLALVPAPQAFVLGPDNGEILTGADQIDSVLTSLAGLTPDLEVREVVVTVGPVANVAWFRATIDLPERLPAGQSLRATGVFVRTEGVWELQQAHLSLPISARDSIQSNPEPSDAPSEADE